VSASEREPWPRFLKIMAWVGLNTFGGPVAQIGFMHKELVERLKWFTEDQFLHLLNFANVIPGPEALELCIHAGYVRRGVWGGIVAGLLFIWPGFASLTLLGWLYVKYGQLSWMAAALQGIRPVAIALIATAAVRISRKTLRGGDSFVLMACAFIASAVFDLPFISILLATGALGGLWGAKRARTKARPLWGWGFLALVLAVMTLQVLRPAALTPQANPRPVPTAGPSDDSQRLAQIAWVNAKAALLTFGGAYTALPFLREQYVEKHGWLSDPQMMDGLALGETTPGPLISIGVFTAFLSGGWAGAVAGGIALFLPSFVLVLGLGRFMARIEALPRAKDVLWGFSAGTLGLIVALASRLVQPNLPDAFSVALSAFAFVAVWRFEVNLIWAVLAGAGLGILRSVV
jgi:chromate transporter